MAIDQQIVPNMIQGVTQQADQVRRNTQCDSQFDCLNQAVEGCVPRPGLEWHFKADPDSYTGAFFYDIIRSDTERYTAVIQSDGTLEVWNYLTGTKCTVTVTGTPASYLSALGGNEARTSFAACSADDITFIANKRVSPQLLPPPTDPWDTEDPNYGNIEPPRPDEALFYFKAGAYKNTYTIRIFIETVAEPDGVWFEWEYETPDNSLPENAAYIATDAICYALYNAMVTDVVNPIASGLGFNIARNGNLIRLWREDDIPFSIETKDGQSNTQLLGLKDYVPGFDKLPSNGFNGMVFRVQGDPTDDSDDYFVKFVSNGEGESTTNGVWEECAAPMTQIKLDPATMPIQLVNTGLNTFTLKYSTWGDRLNGDGVDSARNPSFINHFIEDIFFDQRRLAVMTTAANMWSRVNNVFTFFPDTVQTNLATAPIDIEVKAAKRIAILRKPLQAGAQTFLWAEGQQFLVSHGDNSTFSGETIEVVPSTSYEWDNVSEPIQIGASIIFGTVVGRWSLFTDAMFREGQALGETGIADHVPRYIPKGVIEKTGSDTLKKMVVLSEDTPSLLYLYEYRLSAQERLQSAWNTWRLPSGSTILHILLDKDTLYAWVQRSDGLHVLSCSLQPAQEDPEGPYLTRLDFKMTEAECTVTFDAITNQTYVDLPVLLDDAQDHMRLEDGDFTTSLVIRESTGEGEEAFYRGVVYTPVEVGTNAGATRMTFTGDISAAHFYTGLRIRSERTENTFYVKDEQSGYSYKKKVDVRSVVLSHDGSGYFRVETLRRKDGAVTKSQNYEGKAYGDGITSYDKVILGSGDFEYAINLPNTEHKVRFVNDSPFPCTWQGLVWNYVPVVTAQPGR